MRETRGVAITGATAGTAGAAGNPYTALKATGPPIERNGAVGLDEFAAVAVQHGVGGRGLRRRHRVRVDALHSRKRRRDSHRWS